MSVNPMHALLKMQQSPRCRAKSKRSQQRCKSPAVRGWEVCRMHGARSGAPKGERNGKFETGLHTAEAKENAKALRRCLRTIRALLRDGE